MSAILPLSVRRRILCQSLLSSDPACQRGRCPVGISFDRALPDDCDPPARFHEGIHVPEIAAAVCSEFRAPEVFVGFRSGAEVAARMSVPEATEHFYDAAPFRQNNIRAAWQVLTMQPIPEAAPVKPPPYYELGKGVLSSNCRHVSGACRAIDRVCHGPPTAPRYCSPSAPMSA